MARKNEENRLVNYEALKAHVAITGHLPDKHSTLNNWVRYQRKRMKARIMLEKTIGKYNTLYH